MILVLLSGCLLLDAAYKDRFGTTPEELDDGWEIASPEAVGLDPALLATMHAELLKEDRFFGTLGVLIVKDGKLVFETYLRDPADRDHVNHLQSATKSVTSMLVGIAQEQGALPSLDTPACDLLGDACDGLADCKHDITLRHLLTMRSGLDLSNDFMAYDLVIKQPDDPLRFLLELPLLADPGRVYSYRDVDPQVMAYVLQAVMGCTEEAFAADVLFAPLGIEDWYWVALHDGASTGAFGLHLRPRDFAKVGELALEGGTWSEGRVVPEAWLDDATVAIEDNAWESWSYGMYFWTSPEGDAHTIAGHGGQFTMWFPESNLLAVQIAMSDAELHGSTPADFYELVHPLVQGLAQ